MHKLLLASVVLLGIATAASAQTASAPAAAPSGTSVTPGAATPATPGSIGANKPARPVAARHRTVKHRAARATAQ